MQMPIPLHSSLLNSFDTLTKIRLVLCLALPARYGRRKQIHTPETDSAEASRDAHAEAVARNTSPAPTAAGFHFGSINCIAFNCTPVRVCCLFGNNVRFLTCSKTLFCATNSKLIAALSADEFRR